MELEPRLERLVCALPGMQDLVRIGASTLTNDHASQKAVKNADGSKRFSVAEINAISIPAYALMLLAMLAFAYVHSRTGWHTVWIIVQEVSHSWLLLRWLLIMMSAS